MMDFVSVILFNLLTASVKCRIGFAWPIEEAGVVSQKAVRYEILNF
jgi:hypothetical protein